MSVLRKLTPETAALISERFRALGEPMRLALLHQLRGGERSVSDLVAALGAGQANVSKHLQLLRRHGFVARRKEGVTTWYRIADPSVFELCDLVCGGIRAEARTRRRLVERLG
ncbi:MAG TPA: metalloregulator ArsR/SmtB family transcription factor [Gemmatimonadales bacterium]|nr:metalloregulator ArsR/SmtB family transcription factor [Gemmatimonadales bacterium]